MIAIFRSNPISPNPRVEKAAAVAARLGPVFVVGWDRTGKLPARQARAGYQLRLFSLPAPFGSGIRNLRNLLRWELFLLGWVLKNGRRCAIFHACDFDTIFPALAGRLLFGTRVIYDICDFYADHIRNTPAWLIRWIRRLDRWAVRRADAVILVDEARTAQLAEAAPERLVFVYNTPADIGGSSEPAEPGVEFRVAYIGTLQVERGLLELFEVIERHHPKWRLDLAGFGGDEALILARARQVPGVAWHGRVDYARALAISASADALIATYDPAVPNHRYSSPNKLFEAMMLGKPIVVAQDTHMDQIVREWKCGLVVPYGDREALDQALQKLAHDPALRKELGQNARKAYDEKYSWKIMSERLENLYRQLLTAAKKT